MPDVLPEGCTKNFRMPQAKLAKPLASSRAVSHCQPDNAISLQFLFLPAAILAGHQAAPVDLSQTGSAETVSRFETSPVCRNRSLIATRIFSGAQSPALAQITGTLSRCDRQSSIHDRYRGFGRSESKRKISISHL